MVNFSQTSIAYIATAKPRVFVENLGIKVSTIPPS